MHKRLILVLFIYLTSCDKGNLNTLADLPRVLNEASGIETTTYSDLIWMVNDSGNASKIYAVNENGSIKKELNINAKNNDWEDLASDYEGNIYIGDFGNNKNRRKNLAILKISKAFLNKSDKVNAERISFKYPNQKKIPPKKNNYILIAKPFFITKTTYIYLLKVA